LLRKCSEHAWESNGLLKKDAKVLLPCGSFEACQKLHVLLLACVLAVCAEELPKTVYMQYVGPNGLTMNSNVIQLDSTNFNYHFLNSGPLFINYYDPTTKGFKNTMPTWDKVANVVNEAHIKGETPTYQNLVASIDCKANREKCLEVLSPGSFSADLVESKMFYGMLQFVGMSEDGPKLIDFDGKRDERTMLAAAKSCIKGMNQRAGTGPDPYCSTTLDLNKKGKPVVSGAEAKAGDDTQTEFEL
jgi:hypothetical protein